jgi:hypothetical protein
VAACIEPAAVISEIARVAAYGGYNLLLKIDLDLGPLAQALRWSHARRKFLGLDDIASNAKREKMLRRSRPHRSRGSKVALRAGPTTGVALLDWSNAGCRVELLQAESDCSKVRDALTLREGWTASRFLVDRSRRRANRRSQSASPRNNPLSFPRSRYRTRRLWIASSRSRSRTTAVTAPVRSTPIGPVGAVASGAPIHGRAVPTRSALRVTSRPI